MAVVTYTIISIIIVSVVSVVAAVPLLLKKKVSKKLLIFLLSVSVGVLLSTVFIDFLPEAVSDGYTLGVAIYILLGFLFFFVLEKLIHWQHHKHNEHEHIGHAHAYSLAPINLIGEAVHNFIDGLVIAGSYAVNVGLGVAATISIVLHEVPQEIADFGILLYAGLSKKKALLFNFLSAATAIVGGIVGLILVNSIKNFNSFIIPFAAGNFLYIAASNLVPQLHRHCKLSETILHIIAIMLGIGLMILITLFGPGHAH